MLKTLTTFGFKETDAQLYVYLLTEGAQQAKNVAEALKICKRKLYRDLKKLQQKGIINVNQEHPAEYSAIPFDKILDLLIKTHMKEAQRIEQEKEEILSQWHAAINKQPTS